MKIYILVATCNHIPVSSIHKGNFITVNVLKYGTLLFLFSTKMFVISAETRKMLVRIANREDPGQTASSEAV